MQRSFLSLNVQYLYLTNVIRSLYSLDTWGKFLKNLFRMQIPTERSLKTLPYSLSDFHASIVVGTKTIQYIEIIINLKRVTKKIKKPIIYSLIPCSIISVDQFFTSIFLDKTAQSIYNRYKN